MFKVNGSIGVQLLFGGQEYPLSRDSFEDICIIENACQILPTCRLILNDIQNFFSSLPIQEGAFFHIILTNDASEKEAMNSYCFSVTGEPQKIDNESYSTYIVQGIAPYLHLLRDRLLFTHEGNSNEVIEKIAEHYNKIYTGDLEIQTDCDDFEDKMIWFSGNRSSGQFLQYISDFGYKDEKSCACICSTYKNNNTSSSSTSSSTNSSSSAANTVKLCIRYKNINNEENDEKLTFTMDKSDSSSTENSDSKSISYNSIQTYSDASLYNMLYGNRYLHTDHLFDCKCDDNSDSSSNSNNNEKIYKNIKIPNNYSEYLDMDKGLLSDEEDKEYNVRMEFSPLDCGNNHKHFWRAYFQNKRFRCAFSTHKSVITIEETGLQLLDKVKLKEFTGYENETDDNIAEKFVVTAKTRCINDNYVYCERLLLSTTGPSQDNIGNLTGSSSK